MSHSGPASLEFALETRLAPRLAPPRKSGRGGLNGGGSLRPARRGLCGRPLLAWPCTQPKKPRAALVAALRDPERNENSPPIGARVPGGGREARTDRSEALSLDRILLVVHVHVAAVHVVMASLICVEPLAPVREYNEIVLEARLDPVELLPVHVCIPGGVNCPDELTPYRLVDVATVPALARVRKGLIE